ncbi:MAG: Peptidoglycan hydrolase FlgJ [Accumulibacter sp.]|uniref:flagellar assembly peptidoglycan hydrolase FlgJ n=1 Tax=Accumulibacter sp. TaxID=2053492 RepID=UPI0011FC5E10|nr:flagellar assembly peptidoglycan hydrolase FlgJ [Accumulibacter sp.]TLD47342.1 MAG: Peptidoglycan hydrolase FlgJ [Accumulibacter sp.]
MKAPELATQRLVLDPAAAGDLRNRLRTDPQAGVRQAARQFEGMLLHLMLKSMRDATPTSGVLDSEQSRFFAAIGDQQLAQELASQAPLGFAGLIERQLARQRGGVVQTVPPVLGSGSPVQSVLPARRPLPAVAAAQPEVPRAAAATPDARADSAQRRRDFVDRVWSHAVEAATRTGVPAHFLVAQSALESGWGKRELRMADGSPSFNVFGIKAGRGWSGATVEVQTTEFVDGMPQSVRAKFRAYDSYAEAFRDYAQLLSNHPRYASVIGQQDGVQFARSLQRAGYATDPMYADKLARIIGGSTLRQALSAA